MITDIFPKLHPVVEAALFAGLVPPRSAALDSREWTDDVVTTLIQYRLAVHALEVLDAEGIAIGPVERSRLERACLEYTVHNMQLHAAIGPVQRLLHSHGIASVAIKGMAVTDAHDSRYPRFFGDIDLLVDPRQFRAAIAIFVGAGFTHEHPSLWNRWFAKSVNLLDAEDCAIDLQRAFAPWCWSRRLRFADVLRRACVSADLCRLGYDDALITTATALVADLGDDHEKLVPWRDLAALVPMVDVHRTADIARTAGVNGVVALVLDALPASIRPRHLIDALGGPQLQWGKRLRWRLLTNRALAERYWFVRVTRNLPVSRLLPGIAALAVLPPDAQPITSWWRSIASGLAGQHPLVWQRPVTSAGAASASVVTTAGASSKRPKR